MRESITDTPQKILEYGCGIGRNLEFIKQYFPKSGISGCDISKESLQYAKKNNGITLYHLGKDKIDEKFDLIIDNMCFSPY